MRSIVRALPLVCAVIALVLLLAAAGLTVLLLGISAEGDAFSWPMPWEARVVFVALGSSAVAMLVAVVAFASGRRSIGGWCALVATVVLAGQYVVIALLPLLREGKMNLGLMDWGHALDWLDMGIPLVPTAAAALLALWGPRDEKALPRRKLGGEPG